MGTARAEAGLSGAWPSLVARRALQAVPLLFAVVAFTFVLLSLAPGDFLATMAENPAIEPATIEAMRRDFGLDRPLWEQFARYVANVARGDLGQSFSRHQPVAAVLREGLGNTLLLAVAGALVTWGLALPLGVWAAVRRGTAWDRGLSALAVLGLSIPEVLSGLLLLLLAASTGWFPVGGMRSLDHESLGPAGRALDVLRHLVLPALVVGIVPLAARMRQMSTSLTETLRQDYVTTARAKGLPERVVVLKHALPNALNPMITLFGFTLGSLLSGSLVAEVIFGWPGLGRITLEAIQTEDQYLVMGGVLLASVVLMAGNLVADLLLLAVDPRLRDG